jgi:coenzyme F420-0:L-glutamate ligase / coenzyme F420-1:gamma-L-glutamate ligase
MATRSAVSLLPVTPFPMVAEGDDVAEMILAKGNNLGWEDGDVVVVTGKVISKAEGRLVALRTVMPSPRALALAALTEKDPRLVELVLRESIEVVRARPGVLLVRHRLGFVSAMAGIDRSNVNGGEDEVLLFPIDPDASAVRLRDRLQKATGRGLGLVISDSHGRPFRVGNIGVAIGVAGLLALIELEGTPDLFGRPLSRASVMPVADVVACAAGLVSGEAAEGVPVVVVRGAVVPVDDGRAGDLLRSPESDLFAQPDCPYD